MVGSGGHYPEWDTQSQKNSNDMYSLISGYKPRNLEYPRYKIQFVKHMKLKKKEDQSVDTLVLLRNGNKIPMEGVTESKCGTETEGMTIHRLPHLRIYSIDNHQTQILLQMPTSACWLEPDIAVSWEALPVPDKYRSGCSQSSIGWSIGFPMKELKKVPKELKGSAAL